MLGVSFFSLVLSFVPLVFGQSYFPWPFPAAVARATRNIAKVQSASRVAERDQTAVFNGLVQRGSADLEQVAPVPAFSLARRAVKAFVQDLIDDAAALELKQACLPLSVGAVFSA